MPIDPDVRVALNALDARITALEGGTPPPPPPPSATYSLKYSTNPARTSPANLAGATVSGNIYVFTAPDTSNILSVGFWLDNPNHTGAARRTETQAPYDFEGAVSQTQAIPLNVSSLSGGSHNITAEIKLADGTSQFTAATFAITATPPPPPPPPPPPSGSGYQAARAAGAPAGSPTVTWSGGAGNIDLTNRIVNVSAGAQWGLLRPSNIKLRNVTITVAGSGYARTAWLAGGPVDIELVKITRLTDGFKGSSGMRVRKCWITDLAPSSFGEGHGDAIQFESSGSDALIEDCILEGLSGGSNTNAAIQSEGGWDRVHVRRCLLRGGNFNMFIRTFNGTTPTRFVLTDCVFDGASARYGMLSVDGSVQVVQSDVDPNTLARDTKIWVVRPKDINGNSLTASQLTASR